MKRYWSIKKTETSHGNVMDSSRCTHNQRLAQTTADAIHVETRQWRIDSQNEASGPAQATSRYDTDYRKTTSPTKQISAHDNGESTLTMKQVCDKRRMRRSSANNDMQLMYSGCATHSDNNSVRLHRRYGSTSAHSTRARCATRTPTARKFSDRHKQLNRQKKKPNTKKTQTNQRSCLIAATKADGRQPHTTAHSPT